MNRIARAAILMLLATSAIAQDITAEEMTQLDALRKQMSDQGLQITPEQEVRLLQRLRAMKKLVAQQPGASGGGPALLQQIQQVQQRQGGAQAAASAAPPVSEQELLQRLASLPAAEPVGSLQYLADGLVVNGQRFVDAMGRAERIGVDRSSGRAGYVVRSGAESLVRVAALGTAAESITIGVLRTQGGQQVLETVTGKRIAGELFFALPDGGLILRESVGFRYKVGDGVRQINLPAGWFPTPLQRGNLGTGWLLLEKDVTEHKKSQLPFVGLANKIGEIAGTREANEYALFDTQTGRMVVLDISTDGKSVTEGTQCRRRSGVVNVCDQVTALQTAWEPDGTPNWRHYFWRVDWQQVRGRFVAVVQERRSVQVNLYDLKTGAKVNLFERSLGLTAMNVEPSSEGRLRVTARLGFETGVINDAMERLPAGEAR